jgi:hypothetical protein
MLLLLNFYPVQYLGDEGWFQADRMSGLHRLIGHRLKRHSSTLILKDNLAVLAGCAASGTDQTEQDQQKRRLARKLSFRIL